MIVYKVFYKNYELKKGELMGMLIERKKDLRGMKQVESGLRWAKLTFSPIVKDKKAIFVVPNELKLEGDGKGYMEKGVFNKEEFLEKIRLVDQERKRKQSLSGWKGTERERESYQVSRITVQGGLPSLGKRRP